MSLPAWLTPFLTTDQKGSEPCPWVTTASFTFRLWPPPLETAPPWGLEQASRNAARPGIAARPAPPMADFLRMSRRVRSISLFPLLRSPGCRRVRQTIHELLAPAKVIAHKADGF